MDKTYYQMLGVSQDADSTTIKNAFRKLAKKYHPDINPGNAEAEKMFKDVNEAYSVLSDEGKRAKYDRELADGVNGFGQAQSHGNQSQATRQKSAANPFMGFGQGFDFDACMGAGMKFEKEYTDSKKQKEGNSAPDFMNVNAQFAKFFGFTPKK